MRDAMKDPVLWTERSEVRAAGVRQLPPRGPRRWPVVADRRSPVTDPDPRRPNSEHRALRMGRSRKEPAREPAVHVPPAQRARQRDSAALAAYLEAMPSVRRPTRRRRVHRSGAPPAVPVADRGRYAELARARSERAVLPRRQRCDARGAAARPRRRPRDVGCGADADRSRDPRPHGLPRIAVAAGYGR